MKKKTKEYISLGICLIPTIATIYFAWNFLEPRVWKWHLSFKDLLGMSLIAGLATFIVSGYLLSLIGDWIEKLRKK